MVFRDLFGHRLLLSQMACLGRRNTTVVVARIERRRIDLLGSTPVWRPSLAGRHVTRHGPFFAHFTSSSSNVCLVAGMSACCLKVTPSTPVVEAWDSKDRRQKKKTAQAKLDTFEKTEGVPSQSTPRPLHYNALIHQARSMPENATLQSFRSCEQLLAICEPVCPKLVSPLSMKSLLVTISSQLPCGS